jgi:DNA repair protein RadC
METNLSAGHRQRLLKRFEDNGISSLADYEIVELLLTFIIPRRDTKPIAKHLIAKYKTVWGVLNASADALTDIEGVGKKSALLFPLMNQVMAYCLKEKCADHPVMAQRTDVEAYLRFHFGMRQNEYVAVLFLDTGNHVIATDCIAEGTVNQCAVYPRSIVQKALQYGAASIIIAHNHPGGGKNPSEADWLITERLFTIGQFLELPLLDHVIVTRDVVVSLRDFQRWPKKAS